MPSPHYPLERLRWPCGFVFRPVAQLGASFAEPPREANR
jgi:hypothetical protein